METNTILQGDALEVMRTLPDESIHCCVTSPPYWALRTYGVDGQYGLEATPGEFVEKMVKVFREVRRVLRPDGTLWLNLGDTYMTDAGKQGARGRGGTEGIQKYVMASVPLQAPNRFASDGLKAKDLVGIPWRVALALQADGWYLRQDIVWSKTNPMPESIKDRCTKSHEYIFLLAKSERYYFDHEAIQEPAVSTENLIDNLPAPAGTGRYGGRKYTENPNVFFRTKSGNLYKPKLLRNKRSVWSIPIAHCNTAHFATFPQEIPRLCMSAGCPPGGIVLDPFMGSGTVGLVAVTLTPPRRYLGIELNPDYIEMAEVRIKAESTGYLFEPLMKAE